jgi:hypothetical protein
MFKASLARRAAKAERNARHDRYDRYDIGYRRPEERAVSQRS